MKESSGDTQVTDGDARRWPRGQRGRCVEHSFPLSSSSQRKMSGGGRDGNWEKSSTSGTRNSGREWRGLCWLDLDRHRPINARTSLAHKAQRRFPAWGGTSHPSLQQDAA